MTTLWPLFNMLTEGDWWVDLVALAASLTAAGVVWRIMVWPVLRAIWAAILAAPKIAVSVDTLINLVEGDVLSRLEDGSKRFDRQGATLTDHEGKIAGLDARVTIVERWQDAHSGDG